MSLTSVQAIDVQIQQLEARKRLVQSRDAEVNAALGILQKYAPVLTPSQHRRMLQLAGESSVPVSPGPSGRRPHPSKGKILGKQAPRYRLPTGETWSGRGHTPHAFSAWAATVDGKAWLKAHPDEKFPPVGKPSVAPDGSAKVPDRRIQSKKMPAKKGPSKKRRAK